MVHLDAAVVAPIRPPQVWSPCLMILDAEEQEIAAQARELLEGMNAEIVAGHRGGVDPAVILLAWPGRVEEMAKLYPRAEMVALGECGDTGWMVEAMRWGAADCVTRPVRAADLVGRVLPLLAAASGRQRRIERAGNVVARSAAMQEILGRVMRLAPFSPHALVHGESGTGKETVARLLHRLGPGAGEPFEILLAGSSETPPSGTVFVEEVGEAPLSWQSWLARVLAQKRAPLRVVAATRHDPAVLLSSGLFHPDLYYRLAALEVKLPALRERPDDIPCLAEFFLERAGERRRVSARALRALASYAWPGNVRELECTMEYVAQMADGPAIEVRHLPDRVLAETHADDTDPTLEAACRRHVRQTLARTGGNKLRAARLLGISRMTLYRYLGQASN
jgi:DNA-binding NtrC family response regulator